MMPSANHVLETTSRSLNEIVWKLKMVNSTEEVMTESFSSTGCFTMNYIPQTTFCCVIGKNGEYANIQFLKCVRFNEAQSAQYQADNTPAV